MIFSKDLFLLNYSPDHNLLRVYNPAIPFDCVPIVEDVSHGKTQV